ncbi:MAG: hypothetical protein EBU84_02190 [Actinobacteria bacterium]|nr:hypothetical protein [Actinomycetota bacterium]
MTSEFSLAWGEPQIVKTKEGIRSLRKAPPTDAFWTAWRSGKEGLKAKGFSVVKAGSAWEVCHWQIPTQAPSDPLPVHQEPSPLLNAQGLLSYQVEPAQALAAALRGQKAALDASDTGIGKTYQTLAAFRDLNIAPLVICPKAVIPSWERAAKHLRVPLAGVINYEKVRLGRTPYGKRLEKQSGGRTYEYFAWSPAIKGLIFDEAHRCKSTKSQNADLLIGAALQQIPTIAASATAATNPMEMRALGFLLGLHGLRDFWDWASAHGCYRNDWDGWEFGGSAEDIQSIHKSIFPGRGVRVRIADLGNLFPRTQIGVELVPVASPELIDRSYEEVRKAIDAVRQKAAGDSDAAEHLTAQLRSRQVSELQKLPALIELAKDALEEGRSVFIGVNFTDSIRVIAAAFKMPVATIHGQQTGEERQRNIDAFQADKVRLIIANLRAGGVGVSLHDTHGRFPRTALISPSWSAADLKQALGRVHRSGGKSASIQRIVYAAGTIEERVAQSVGEKLKTLSILNDGVESTVTDSDLNP